MKRTVKGTWVAYNYQSGLEVLNSMLKRFSFIFSNKHHNKYQQVQETTNPNAKTNNSLQHCTENLEKIRPVASSDCCINYSGPYMTQSDSSDHYKAAIAARLQSLKNLLQMPFLARFKLRCRSRHLCPLALRLPWCFVNPCGPDWADPFHLLVLVEHWHLVPLEALGILLLLAVCQPLKVLLLLLGLQGFRDHC